MWKKKQKKKQPSLLPVSEAASLGDVAALNLVKYVMKCNLICKTILSRRVTGPWSGLIVTSNKLLRNTRNSLIPKNNIKA